MRSLWGDSFIHDSLTSFSVFLSFCLSVCVFLSVDFLCIHWNRFRWSCTSLSFCSKTAITRALSLSFPYLLPHISCFINKKIEVCVLLCNDDDHAFFRSTDYLYRLIIHSLLITYSEWSFSVSLWIATPYSSMILPWQSYLWIVNCYPDKLKPFHHTGMPWATIPCCRKSCCRDVNYSQMLFFHIKEEPAFISQISYDFWLYTFSNWSQVPKSAIISTD